MMRFFLIGLIALLLGGCGTFADPTSWFDEDNPELKPAELQDVVAKIKPVELWSRDIGDVSGEFSRLVPVVVSGVIYAIDADGDVQAIEAESGTVLWEKETGLSAAAGPGVGEGLLLIGTSEAEVVALDQETGEEKWRHTVSGEVLAVPAISYGIVVVHTVDGNLFGLDSTSGERRWRYDRKVPVLTLHGTSSPVISGSTVIAGLAGGKLVALAADTGVLEWERKITVPGGRSDLDRITDIDTDPLIYNGTVFVGSYQGEVAAVGEGSGKVFWNRKLSTYNSMAVNWQQLYVTDDNGHVWALDPDTGAAKWRQQELKNRKLSAPAIVGDYVVVGDFKGYLHWLSSNDGSVVARMRMGGSEIVAAPFVVDEVLYVFNTDGDLTAIKLPEE